MTPPPDPELRPALQRACAALGLEPSARQQQQLLDYVALLKRWNATYNLTAIRDEAAMLTQHVVDCLTVIEPLKRQVGSLAAGRLLDVGSGAGLPGCVIAIMAPEAHIVCVDSVGKKAAFTRQVAAELRLSNLRAEHARVEALARGEGFDAVTARAFASLADFFTATEALAKPGGVWMAMKGRRPDSEIAALPATAQVFHVEQLIVPDLAAERCLVWMRRSGDRDA